MSLSLRQLHPLFVGEVSGVDVKRPLDTAAVAALDHTASAISSRLFIS